MGLFSFFFGKKEEPPKPQESASQKRRREWFSGVDMDPLPGCDQQRYTVAGTSFRMDAILRMGSPNPDFKLDKGPLYRKGLLDVPVFEYIFPPVTAELVPEPTNAHDPNAIKVIMNGVHVGYVPAKNCVYIKSLMNSGKLRRVQGFIGGGTSRTLNTGYETYENEKKIPIRDLRIERNQRNISVKIFVDAEMEPPKKRK